MSKLPDSGSIPCPRCRKKATWQGNPHRPFCSETCRLIDLGCWADGAYRIAGEPAPGTGEEKVLPLRGADQEWEES